MVKTVHQLVDLEKPEKVPDRLPRQSAFGSVEFTTFQIDADLYGWKISKGDNDIHLVVHDRSTDESMIVEFPNEGCIPDKASDLDRKKMIDARKAIETACVRVKLSGTFRLLDGSAIITGVGFFDKIHRQTGVAHNGIELHPALSFQSATCGPKM